MTASVQPLEHATTDDLDDLVSLIRLLGYSLDSHALEARLARLTPVAGHETWVVRDSDRRIAAVAGGHITWAYNSDRPTSELLLLVVRSDIRRDGTGSLLLTHFEEWARGHNASIMSAVSAAATDTAHRFYQKRGYHETGTHYTKLG